MFNFFFIKYILVFEFIKASQDDASNTIYYLFSLCQILILNHCKYFDMQINNRLSLFVEEIDNNVSLAILSIEL